MGLVRRSLHSPPVQAVRTNCAYWLIIVYTGPHRAICKMPSHVRPPCSVEPRRRLRSASSADLIDLSILFPRLISAVADWMSYFHTWCGLSANSGCRSEMCCTRLPGNTRRKKIAICAVRTIAQLCRAVSSELGMYRQNMLNSNTSSMCPYNRAYGQLWLTNG